MKKLLLVVVINLLICPFGWSQDKEIDALVQPYVKTNNFSGSILIAQSGKPTFSKSYGLMNRSYNLPNTARTKFYLASVSMIFTSAAIMKLVETKQISLDDKLSKYLPTYKHGDRLTLHHLLSQRSGIPAIGQNKKVDYDSLTKFGHTTDQLIGYFKEDSLLFEPNSDYNHGRSDYILLAYIIEKVTGKPYGVYLKETLFDPLQMTNTGHSTGEKTIVPDLAIGYAAVGHFEVENAYQIDWTSKTGHGSIYSTTEDLHKFANAILNSRLLTKESWQKVFTNYGDNVGYGWFISGHLNKKRVQMNGRSPGFSSYFGIYPDDKAVVIVLSNNYISLPADLGKQLAALVFKQPYTKTNLTVTDLKPEQVRNLTGKYKFDKKFYVPDAEMEVSFKDGKLFTNWGALIPMEESKGQVTKYILRNFWSELEFVQNPEGQVNEMLFSGFKGIRVK